MRGKKWEGVCSVEKCGKPIKALGLCQNHYMRQWMYGRTYSVVDGTKRKHPFYSLWFERKQSDDLVPEWIDFWQFVKDIGSKPNENCILVRLREGPYGPHNFKWYETLRRKPGESNRVWYARKWQSRRQHFPNFDNERRLRRAYGIGLADYDAMFAEQNGVCAICKHAETSFDSRTNGIKRLAVDHSHKTGKVRALLCFRCNSTIGRIGEDHDLMLAMSDYLKKHA